MADKTKIEWCDATFNPWVGCTPVSPACDHCYAESWAKRTGHPELWMGERRRTTASNWSLPLKWNLAADSAGVRKRVFCASLADVFDNQVPSQWRAELWELIAKTPNLDFLLLTKRPQNIAKMLPPMWGSGWPNVWLGTTCEDRAHYEQRWTHLCKIPAAVRFISYEPALGPLSLFPLPGFLGDGCPLFPDWLIAGGESGPYARIPEPAWFSSIRDQCAYHGVAFFFKQWGGRTPKAAGRLLDGVEHSEFPVPRRNENIAPAA